MGKVYSSYLYFVTEKEQEQILEFEVTKETELVSPLTSPTVTVTVPAPVPVPAAEVCPKINLIPEFPFTTVFNLRRLVASLFGYKTEEDQTTNFRATNSVGSADLPDPESLNRTISVNKMGTQRVDDDTAGGSLAVESSGPGPGCDLSPIKAALDIPHIFEKILSLLEIPDLLHCRLVSQRWRSVSTEQLQKEISLSFHDYFLKPKQENKSLMDLTNLVQNSSSFPCTKFALKFSSETLSSPALQNFLDTTGVYIKDLTLTFPHTAVDLLRREKELIELIKTLILHQIPNVRFLSLRVASEIKWHDDDEDQVPSRVQRSPLRVTDLEFHEVLSQLNRIKERNTELKVLTVEGEMSSKMLEVIIQLCPKLEEISVAESNQSYLLEPLNRTHLVKKLELSPYKYGIDVLEQIAVAFSEKSGGHHRLREIYLNLEERCSRLSWGEAGTRVEARFVKVVNQLLESSSNCLETLRWDGVTFLQGLKWPRVMPSVSKIEFRHPRGLSGSRSLFPPGFSFSQTFPKLHTVHLCDDWGRVDFISFVKSLNFEPVSSVKSVHIFNWNRKAVPSEQLELIRELFLGARLTHEWVL